MAFKEIAWLRPTDPGMDIKQAKMGNSFSKADHYRFHIGPF